MSDDRFRSTSELETLPTGCSPQHIPLVQFRLSVPMGTDACNFRDVVHQRSGDAPALQLIGDGAFSGTICSAVEEEEEHIYSLIAAHC